jgi:Zn-dependent protease
MILDGTKLKMFTFLGAPVRLSLFFLLLLPMVGFDITFFISIFISVLVHEMAHAFVAHKKGYSVYGIDIDLFTGSASMDSNMHQRDSLWVSLAGPFSNLILAILSLLLMPYLHNVMDVFFGVNISLFIFNMLPIYPMDGGMVFRDLLMLNMRDRRQASKIANWTSIISSLVGFLVIIIFTKLWILAILFAIFCYISLKKSGYVK